MLEGVYDRFVDRFLAACPTIPIGDPAQPGTIVNPVIDGAAQKSIFGYIEQGKKEATLAWQATLSSELAPKGIYCNCVAPGWVSTEMSASAFATPELAAQNLAAVPGRE